MGKKSYSKQKNRRNLITTVIALGLTLTLHAGSLDKLQNGTITEKIEIMNSMGFSGNKTGFWYFVKYLNVNSDLAIEAGATLVFVDGGRVNVDDTGSLNAVGTPEKRITFTSISKTPGAWGGIQFTFSNDAKNVLDNVIVEYGGDAQNGTANVISFGGANLPQRLKLTNSILRYSSAYGFDFSDGLTLTEFTNNTIVNNDGAPGRVGINVVPSLDASNDYSGNGTDFLDVSGTNITKDQTWRKLNVDYRITSVNVDYHWTIDPGVKLIFDGGGFIDVDADGALTAIGETNNPIVFTSEDQFAGAWRGIQFTFSNNGNNKLINSIVEYAGDLSGNGAGSVRLFGSNSLASRAEIRGTTIRDGQSYAIWLDKGSNINSDVDTVNTFTNNEFNSVFRDL